MGGKSHYLATHKQSSGEPDKGLGKNGGPEMNKAMDKFLESRGQKKSWKSTLKEKNDTRKL